MPFTILSNFLRLAILKRLNLWCQSIAPSFKNFSTFVFSFWTLTSRRYKFFSLHVSSTMTPWTLFTLQWPRSKEVKHVVDEAVNEDHELVKFDNHWSLKDIPTKDVKGESISIFFPKKNLYHHKMKVWVNCNKMNEENGPKDNVRNGFVIVGFHQRGWTCHHRFFGKSSNYKRSVEKWRCKEVGDCHARIIQLFSYNHIWSLVPLPKGRKPISCKWVFKIKHGVNGEIEHYKARLVARGFTHTNIWSIL